MASVNLFQKFFVCFVIAAGLLFGTTPLEINKKLIRKINNMNTTWRAGVNRVKFPEKFQSGSDRKKLAIPTPPNKTFPIRFDARLHWPKCRFITSRIRDQGACDSSYAVAVASMISDRLCIETKGKSKRQFSAHDVMSCCEMCSKGPPCEGGDVMQAIQHFEEGVVTGGEVGSRRGCKPYGKTFYKGGNEKCVKKCTNPNYKKSYEDDKLYAEDYHSVYGEKAIQQYITEGGSVVSTIEMYEDMLYYRRGIYQHVLGKRLCVHTVKIFGWGMKENTKFWRVMNSHGRNYGNGGIMRFLRGVGHCGIEVADNVMYVGHELREASLRMSTGNAIKPLRGTSLFMQVILYLFLYLNL